MVTESIARNSAYGNSGIRKLVVSARHLLCNSAIFRTRRHRVRHICAVHGQISNARILACNRFISGRFRPSGGGGSDEDRFGALIGREIGIAHVTRE